MVELEYDQLEALWQTFQLRQQVDPTYRAEDFAADHPENLAQIEYFFPILDELNSIASSYPKVAEVYATRADFFAHRNRWSEALSDARTAGKLNPFDESPKMVELRALYNLTYYDEGIKRADFLLAGGLSDATRADTLFWRGFFHKRLHHPEEAIRDIEDSFRYDSWNLPRIITQLTQRGYYDGEVSDAYSDKVRNGLQACIIDPECG